jgi:uncharacterized protein YdeI (YjbR/CyaY-like superfamily)
MIARYFKTSAEFRRWLAAHHDTERELLVGFYKKASGQTGISYKEAVDEALCFGWIDGVRHRIDGRSYTIRFTPRRPGSIWSTVNLRRVRALIRAKRMSRHGRKVYEERNRKKSGLYSFEQRHTVVLASRHARQFRANKKAWTWYRAQAPWYQRTAAFYVESAKQEATRLRRLAILIRSAAAGRAIGVLDRTRYSRRG